MACQAVLLAASLPAQPSLQNMGMSERVRLADWAVHGDPKRAEHHRR